MASSATPPRPSIRHGVRFMTDPGVTMEEALIAVGEQVGFEKVYSAARMSKAAVVFLKEERLVSVLVGTGVFINDQYVQVSPLSVPTTRIVISGVPPFIPDELLEQELRRFGKITSGFRVLNFRCKDVRLKHVISLRRPVFMLLDSPTQSLEVSFKVKHEGGYYTVYASSGSSKCFECGDVGHKRSACPHREQAEPAEASVEQASGNKEQEDAVASTSKVFPRCEQVQSNDSGEKGNTEALLCERPVEQSTVPEEAGALKETSEKIGNMDTGEVLADSEATVKETPVVTKGENIGIILRRKKPIESETEEMDQDDSEVEDSDGSTRVKDLYPLEEINNFLEETFGQSVNIEDHFPDAEKLIRSVRMIQKLVSLDALDGKKRYRLRKHVTAMKKASKLGNRKKVKKIAH